MLIDTYEPQVGQTHHDLVQLVRDYWLHPPSTEPYDLNAPKLVDFSMGQSGVVDAILKGKVGVINQLIDMRMGYL
jgi:hypothetical protein